MLHTLDALIEALSKMRETHGGSCQAGIEDADTNWTLPIERVYFDEEDRRVLIFADYNPRPGDDFPERPDHQQSAGVP